MIGKYKFITETEQFSAIRLDDSQAATHWLSDTLLPIRFAHIFDMFNDRVIYVCINKHKHTSRVNLHAEFPGDRLSDDISIRAISENRNAFCHKNDKFVVVRSFSYTEVYNAYDKKVENDVDGVIDFADSLIEIDRG